MNCTEVGRLDGSQRLGDRLPCLIGLCALFGLTCLQPSPSGYSVGRVGASDLNEQPPAQVAPEKVVDAHHSLATTRSAKCGSVDESASARAHTTRM